MFKFISTTFNLGLILTLLCCYQTPTLAWEHHQLPTAFTQSSTAHYGGNKAPLVLSASHIMTVAANAQGMMVWESTDDGITWQPTQLSHQGLHFTQAYLASESLALAWSHDTAPVLFQRSTLSGSWGGSQYVWPLASWNIVDVNISTTGDIVALVTLPTANKLVEGELYVLTANANGWSTPVLMSAEHALVGDATWVEHDTTLQSVVWSQRMGQIWQVMVSNSSDGQTWSTPLVVVDHIVAPYFQEAAVQIARKS